MLPSSKQKLDGDLGIFSKWRLRQKGQAPVSKAKRGDGFANRGLTTSPSPTISGDLSPPIKSAIEQLNVSVQRLHMTTGLLDGTVKEEQWGNDVAIKAIQIEHLDAGIQEIGDVIERLISQEIQNKRVQNSREGFLPATERFLRSVGQTISPMLKNFLIVAIQGSAVESCLYKKLIPRFLSSIRMDFFVAGCCFSWLYVVPIQTRLSDTRY
jgi:hypothetical protein